MKKIYVLLIIVMATYTTNAQKFEANWESLNKRGIPKWFHQDKFGIFIHWGLYAVPSYAPVIPNSGDSYAEWYWYRIARDKQKDFTAFHNKNYGADFLYPQFEPMFRAEMFDPQQWAQVFKNSG